MSVERLAKYPAVSGAGRAVNIPSVHSATIKPAAIIINTTSHVSSFDESRIDEFICRLVCLSPAPDHAAWHRLWRAGGLWKRNRQTIERAHRQISKRLRFDRLRR